MSTPLTSDIRQHLHDLSQPLTRLQWRLELGMGAASESDLRKTVKGALADSLELTEWIRRIRESIEVANRPTQETAAKAAQGRAA